MTIDPLRVIQPITWAGMQKGGPESPMVCGSCDDWEGCAARDRCLRASDADYERALRTIPKEKA